MMQNFKIHAFVICCMLLPWNLFSQKKSKIELVKADVFEYGNTISQGARRLIGNVILKQDDVTMYCDSAHLFPDDNKFEAFSNIHLERKADQNFDVFSDHLWHNGNEKMASFRKNVKMTDSKVTLTTEYFDYYIDTKIGLFKYGGKIVDSSSVLTSINGYYYAKEKKIIFSKNVRIENQAEKFLLTTDSMHYLTEQKIVFFFGSTHISADTNFMFAKKGWYNTQTGVSEFSDSALYQSKGRSLKADVLSASRNSKVLTASCNVSFFDSTNQIVTHSNYLYYTDSPQFLLLTKKPVVIFLEQADSMFITADSIISDNDTAKLRVIKAYHHVKAYRRDFQFKCDSMVFMQTDSMIRLFGSPVVWSNDYQLSSVNMSLKIKDGHPKMFFMDESAMMISQIDAEKYNQISGRKITGLIRNNQIYKVNVEGMARSIYYTTDTYGVFGINNLECTDMSIYIDNKKVTKVILFQNPKGVMNPPGLLSPKDTRLKGFAWYYKSRPLNSSDIFRWE